MTDLTQRQITLLLTLLGEPSGIDTNRPGGFTALETIALREQLKEMRDEHVQG